MAERRVIKTVNFSAATLDKATPPAPVVDMEAFVEPAEDREYFYERILNMRAPKRGQLPSIEVHIAEGGGIRLADALWDAGYRRLPDEEVERWIPSAGMAGRVTEYDEGVYVRRNDDGSWPSMNSADYIDPDDITITPDLDDDGKKVFRATHIPSGRFAMGKKRVKAQMALLEILDEIEDEEDSDQDE